MSALATKTTVRKALATLTVCLAGGCLTAGPATAVDVPFPVTSVYSVDAAANPGPPNYPEYDPRYEVPRAAPVVEQDTGLEATSIALGALGGVALAGATVGVLRRRDRAALTSA
jgi:LPXTG-motif cell wall-anchored protein